MTEKVLIVGNAHRRANLIEALTNLKGELKMEDAKESVKMELKPRTIKTVLEEWKEDLANRGLGAFWPSWAYGTYIKQDNIKAQANMARLANRKYPDIKRKVVRRHGKNVCIVYNRKTGELLTTKGMSDATKAKIAARNKRVAAQRVFYSEDNALGLITKMIGMPRTLRRNLCKKLGMKWGTSEGYREAEAMILEG